MARSGNVRIKFTADTDGVRKGTLAAERDIDRFSRRSGDRLKGFAGAAAVAGGAAGIGLLTVGLTSSVRAAIEAEKTQARLEAQLKASGVSYEKHADEIERVIQKHSRLAGLDDEDLTDAFTNIVRVTGDVDKSLRLTGLAADFARAKHIDVAKAGEIVGKVAGGNTGILSRYGIQIEKGATASEALAALQGKFAGQAEAYGKTTGGSMDRMRVATENLQEKLGNALAPTVTEVADGLTEFIGEMESGTGTGGKFAKTAGDIAHDVGDVVKTIGKFVEKHPEVVKVAAAMAAVGASVRAIKFASKISGLSTFLSAARTGAGIFRRVWATAGTDAGTTAAGNAADSLAGRMPGAVRGKRARINSAGRIFGGIFAAGAAAVIGAKIGEAIEDALDPERNQDKFDDWANSALPKWLQSIQDARQDAADWIKGLIPGGDGWGRRPFTGDGLGRASAVSLMGADTGLRHYANVASGFGLRVSSGSRPGAVTNSGNPSYHGSGDALDISDGVQGPSAAKLRFAKHMVEHYGGQLEELIYTPLGFSIKNGRRVAAYAQADHMDHVHIADTGTARPAGDGGGSSSSGGSWRDGIVTWYQPSLGGINGREGAGAWAGHPVYDSTWGCAAPKEFAFGTLIEFRLGNKSVLVPVVDRGGAITGTHFDLLPGPAARLGIKRRGMARVKFRVKGRKAMSMKSFGAKLADRRKARERQAARRAASFHAKRQGVMRSVNQKRGERVAQGFEDRFLLATLTRSPADDYQTAVQGFAFADTKVRQYQHGLLHGDKRVTWQMLSDAITERQTWSDSRGAASEALTPDRSTMFQNGGTAAGSGSDSVAQLLADIRAQLAEQNKRAAIIAATEGGVLAQAITHVVTGQIGGAAFLSMQTPGSTGQLARY